MENPIIVGLIALVFLTVMEIVLGIDNIVFIAIITGRLPKEQQLKARRVGLSLALIMRILLLLSLSFVLGLTKPIFELSQLGLFKEWFELYPEVNEIAGRDLILLGGGLFLIGKAVFEIHHQLEDHESDEEE